MLKKSEKVAVLSQLKRTSSMLSLAEISILMANAIPERTLRRWLAEWVQSGLVQRIGKKRGTRYQYISNENFSNSITPPSFLQLLPAHKRSIVLEQIRDLWTHTSTALEGNTLTLGDTHAILGLGLTVSGKPLKEHQEIVGHARAIDLLYQSIQEPLNKALIYELHKAIQTEIVRDIYKPIGAWKVEINGTYAVTTQGEQSFIEYAHPMHVDSLMEEVIQTINSIEISKVTIENAAIFYAKIHMAIVHIHPFWDGNGRLARLLGNIILLKAGLPPLVIEQALRREYIECLADYQIKVGQLTSTAGTWPDKKQLKPFEEFCQQAYGVTKALIVKAGA